MWYKYINNDSDDIHALMFADDVSSMADTVLNLQRQINYIDFCKDTGMNLNLDKSKIIVFRNGGPLLTYERWKFRGNIVEVVPYYTYLGALFTSTLSWNKTKETLSQQASKAVVNILKYQKQFGYFFANEALKLFDSIGVPILCYSADVWGYQYTNVSNEGNPTFVHVYAALISTCQVQCSL